MKLERMTRDDLLGIAAHEGIAVTENATRADIIAALNKAGITEAKVETSEERKAAGEDVYYLFTSPTYVDDVPTESIKLVEAGFYRTGRVLTRYEGKRFEGVVKFEGKPDPVQIAKIAQSRGIQIQTGEKVDYDELLAKLTLKWPF